MTWYSLPLDSFLGIVCLPIAPLGLLRRQYCRVVQLYNTYSCQKWWDPKPQKYIRISFYEAPPTIIVIVCKPYLIRFDGDRVS